MPRCASRSTGSSIGIHLFHHAAGFNLSGRSLQVEAFGLTRPGQGRGIGISPRARQAPAGGKVIPQDTASWRGGDRCPQPSRPRRAGSAIPDPASALLLGRTDPLKRRSGRRIRSPQCRYRRLGRLGRLRLLLLPVTFLLSLGHRFLLSAAHRRHEM